MISENVAYKHLETLYREGTTLAKKFAEEEEGDSFEEGYQAWYSKALPLMQHLGADRYAEFQSYYVVDPKYGWYNSTAYVIQDYFRERVSLDEDFDAQAAAGRCFRNQLAILKSIADRLSWSSLDTEDQAERGLQLAFLETARDLLKIDARAAGALVGTVLETYLKKLATKHKLGFRKNSPTAREMVEALKTAKVLDVPLGSQATWLAELTDRSRSEGETPTKLQVRDLIDGSRWFIANVF